MGRPLRGWGDGHGQELLMGQEGDVCRWVTPLAPVTPASWLPFLSCFKQLQGWKGKVNKLVGDLRTVGNKCSLKSMLLHLQQGSKVPSMARFSHFSRSHY